MTAPWQNIKLYDIEPPSQPRLNPDPDVLDADWWLGFYYQTLPEIKRLARGDVRSVRKALRLVRLAESEIAADL